MPPVTPAQARDLVEHFGTFRAAAEAIGASPATVWVWLNPEASRRQQRRYKRSAKGRRAMWRSNQGPRARERKRAHWHRRGWAVKRRKELHAQRAQAESDLSLLQQEREQLEGGHP